MESYLASPHYDLITPDGKITEIKNGVARVEIENISPSFVGTQIPLELVSFNFKSTLAQLGLNATLLHLEFIPHHHKAICEVKLEAIGPVAHKMLPLLTPGAYIGKLFAADDRRRVRDPEYLSRMFGRSDREGRPLLSLGGMQGTDGLILEKIEGRTVAYLALQEGILTYDKAIEGLLPTIAKALHDPHISLRDLLPLHQTWMPGKPRLVQTGDILLVKTLPLHVRTVFGQVVQEMLPQGVHHTSASILQPDTQASGDIYEVFGSSEKQINDIDR